MSDRNSVAKPALCFWTMNASVNLFVHIFVPQVVKKAKKLDTCVRSKDEAKLANSFSMLQQSSDLLKKLKPTMTTSEKLALLKDFEKEVAKAKLTKAEMKRLIHTCTDDFIDFQVTQRDQAIKMLREMLATMSTTLREEDKSLKKSSKK